VGRSEPVTCGPTPSVDGGNARFALRLGADGTGDGRGEGASAQRDGGASRGPKGVWTGATSELGDDGICAQGLLSTSGRTTNRMYAPAAWTVWTGQMVACGVGLAVIPRRVPGRRCAGRVPATSATIYDRFDRGVVKVLSREQLSVDGYVRVSSVGGRKGERFISPSVQRELIEGWANGRGARVLRIIEELDQSGGRTGRPLLEKALRRVESWNSPDVGYPSSRTAMVVQRAAAPGSAGARGCRAGYAATFPASSWR